MRHALADDEDGIDGPFDRAMEKAMKEDVECTADWETKIKALIAHLEMKYQPYTPIEVLLESRATKRALTWLYPGIEQYGVLLFRDWRHGRVIAKDIITAARDALENYAIECGSAQERKQ